MRARRCDNDAPVSQRRAGRIGGDGRLFLADIAVPPLPYQRMGLAVPALFRDVPVVELHAAAAR